MALDALAKYYALKRVSRLRRVLGARTLSVVEKYGFQIHPGYLSRIEWALGDGWTQYEQFVKANVSDERLKETVESVSDELRSSRMGAKELALQWVDTPVEALTSIGSPLVSLVNIVVTTISIFGLKSAIRRRAIRRLMEPFHI